MAVVPAPAEATAQGLSTTAAYDYAAASSTHLLVTLATWPPLFNQLVLDSLISNPSRNCAGYTVRLPRLATLQNYGWWQLLEVHSRPVRL